MVRKQKAQPEVFDAYDTPKVEGIRVSFGLYSQLPQVHIAVKGDWQSFQLNLSFTNITERPRLGKLRGTPGEIAT